MGCIIDVCAVDNTANWLELKPLILLVVNTAICNVDRFIICPVIIPFNAFAVIAWIWSVDNLNITEGTTNEICCGNKFNISAVVKYGICEVNNEIPIIPLIEYGLNARIWTEFNDVICKVDNVDINCGVKLAIWLVV